MRELKLSFCVPSHLPLTGAAAGILLILFQIPAALAQGELFCQPGETPHLGEEFRVLATAPILQVGEVQECEHTDAANGDVQQHTSNGLLYSRKSTGLPTFTTGTDHWALKGSQLLQWSGDTPDPPDTAQVVATVERNDNSVALPSWWPYVYIGLAIVVFGFNVRNRQFVWDTLWFFPLVALCLSLLLFGSPFVAIWDAGPFATGNHFSIFPMERGDDPAGLARTGIVYWLLLFCTLSLFVTFPQAVLNAWVTKAAPQGRLKNITRKFADGFSGCMVLLGTASLILTGLSLSTYPSANWFLMPLALVGLGLVMARSLPDNWGGPPGFPDSYAWEGAYGLYKDLTSRDKVLKERAQSYIWRQGPKKMNPDPGGGGVEFTDYGAGSLALELVWREVRRPLSLLVWAAFLLLVPISLWWNIAAWLPIGFGAPLIVLAITSRTSRPYVAVLLFVLLVLSGVLFWFLSQVYPGFLTGLRV